MMRSRRASLAALFVLAASACVASAPPAPHSADIYHDQFAIHVPDGEAAARTIAEKHGFAFHGQIGSLPEYYLLSHHQVRRRSVSPSLHHHNTLQKESQVRWIEQQRERRRTKRDYRSGSAWNHLDRPLPPHTNRHRALSGAPYFPDPLFKEQWYLNGASGDGLDMNVGPAWQKGYTGKGVVVSILDDGIQFNHPDLIQNYDATASYDINGNDTDPTPQDNGDNKHGTRCAGEVAAVAFNQYCGVGIAYNASVGGVRMLDGIVNDAVEARALGFNPDHIDIYSASWGPEDDGKTVDGPGPLARRAFIYGVTNGRRGKGSIFVWASGNGGKHTDSCNCDGYTNSIFTLSISSATQGGYKPWYLEECSSTLASTFSSGTPGRDKSVATVDMDGRLRPDHICTAEHTGTSASAPLTAGICALALEANPELTWRDMQYLVVMTSRSQPLEKESGWILNGVKRKVSHKFGYGLMDAAGMVTLAEQWTTVPPQHICKSQEINEDKIIEATYGYTLTVHMDVNGCSGTVNEVRFLEHVQCKISLRFFPRGNLRILLTSPMGTTSTLLFERPRDVVSSNFDDWPFLSVHFWGERAEGRWNLQVNNAGNHHVSEPGILKKWQLIFYGTSSDPIRLRSTQPFADFPGSIRDSEVYNHLTDYYTIDANDNHFNKESDSFEVHNIPFAQRENVLADVNDKRVQHVCDPECDSQGCYGKGPTQCIACKHYRLDNSCVSRCPPRSFANQGGVCWPCHESCETCAGAGQDSCLTCAPMHLLVADLAVCLQQCPEGYLENIDEFTCLPCAPNCASCAERADACLTCEHHLFLHQGSCYASCPLSTYETPDGLCKPCHSSCETCNGSDESQCVSCKAGRYAFNGKCLKKCPQAYYEDKKRRECVPCPIGCSTCNAVVCISCESNWSINKKGECVPADSKKCDSTEYYTEGRCRRCHSTCDSCSGPSEQHCIACQTPLLLEESRCVSSCERGFYQEAGRCARCPHTCAACVSRLNCTSCAGALRLQSGACRTACAAGYFADRGSCTKCYLSCHTCSGPRRDQCVRCPPGWQLAGGECHPECPEGYFRSEVGCHKCHHYCRNCNGSGPLQCTSCPAHFMLDAGLCTECLGSQYYDAPAQACAACHDSCRSCSGPGAFSCVACATPLHLDRLTNQCVPCCAEGASPSNNGSVPLNDCCHCDKETGGCQNSSPAGKRRIAEAEPYRTGDPPRHGVFSDTFAERGVATSALMVAAGATLAVLLSVLFARLIRARYTSRPALVRCNSGYSRLACNELEQTSLALPPTTLTAEDETELEDNVVKVRDQKLSRLGERELLLEAVT